MKVIYLCGPINGCTDAEASNWREVVKSYWPDCIDPMRRDYREKEDSNIKDIVELDKIDIENSDIILVNYDKPSVGTSMEILYAWERGKLVILVSEEKTKLSPWLKYHSHRQFYSFILAIEFIRSL